MHFCHVSSQWMKCDATILSPRANRKNQQWKYLNSPLPKKYKAVHMSIDSHDDFLLRLWGPLLVYFLEHGATFNAKRYADMLQYCNMP